MVKNVNNTEKIFAQRMENIRMNYAGFTWSCMEMMQCMQNFVSRCMITT